MKLAQYNFLFKKTERQNKQKGKEIIEYACMYIAKNKTKDHIHASLKRSALVGKTAKEVKV